VLVFELFAFLDRRTSETYMVLWNWYQSTSK
jgi:hypothetical protein